MGIAVRLLLVFIGGMLVGAAELVPGVHLRHK
jgi:uncharacterized membrane protein